MAERKEITTEFGAMTALAEAICDEWSVGSFSQFCDEPADFDAAPENEVAAHINDTLVKIGWRLQRV